MEIKVKEGSSSVTHILLSGKLDVEGEEQISSDFKELTTTIKKPTIVDMSDVSYLASLGIRLLFTSAKSLADAGTKMVVVNPQPMVEETLTTSGTVSLIPIVRTEEEALQLLKDASAD
jgi:anti-sigma B factor antagonist